MSAPPFTTRSLWLRFFQVLPSVHDGSHVKTTVFELHCTLIFVNIGLAKEFVFFHKMALVELNCL